MPDLSIHEPLEGEPGHQPLNLVYNKNNSEYYTKETPKLEHCPNASYYYKGILDKLNKHIYGRVRCKMRSCPFCRPIENRILRKRLKQSVHRFISLIKVPGFRSKYFCKFLTLTCPGAFYRSEKTPEEADREMNRCFQKLMDSLRKTYGWFEFLRVRELQKDGFPHYHILLIGNSIVPKDIKQYIEKMWEENYQMGWSQIKLVKNVESLIYYLTKYITKELDQGFKGTRVWSASKELRRFSKIEKNDDFTLIEFGKISFDENGKPIYTPIYEINGLSEFEITELKEDIKNQVDEDLFIHKQLNFDFKIAQQLN